MLHRPRRHRAGRALSLTTWSSAAPSTASRTSLRATGRTWATATATPSPRTTSARSPTSYVTVNAERSRFFGADESWRFERQRHDVNNLNSDFFFQRIRDARTVEKLLAQPPPHGPLQPMSRRASGLRRRLQRLPARDRGVGKLPDPTCRGKAWVRPIDEMTSTATSTSWRLAGQRGRRDRRDRRGAAAVRPARPSASTADRARARAGARAPLRTRAAPAPTPTDSARRRPADGHGMVLGNPHFPWQGSERFYQSHLTIPGKVDVTGGQPVRRAARSTDRPHAAHRLEPHGVDRAALHAVRAEARARRRPTAYLYDGQVRRMKADKRHRKVHRRRLARAEHAHALLDRATGRCSSRCSASRSSPWTPTTRLRDGRRQRRPTSAT